MSPEYTSWPFVGRSALMEETASQLKAGRSVILVGGPGVGKTSLANHALSQVQESTTVTFRIRATPAMSDVPYGALGILLSQIDHHRLTHPMFVLQGLGEHLADQAAGRAIVLFIDNVEDLDEMSAVVVSQLVRQRTIVLLCTAGTIGRGSQEISHLWREGSLARVDVGSMNLEETTQLLREKLQGPISRSAVQELWTISEGIPLFLRVLTHEQLGNGNLVRSEQGWVLVAPVSVLNRQSADILVTWFKRFTPEQLLVVEVVSMAGSLPLDLLMKVAGQTDLDSLEEEGILDVEAGRDHLVRIRQNFVADVVRRNVPLGRACELRERLVEAGSNSSYPPTNSLAFATWTLDCGSQLDPELALAAAKDANELEDPASALKFLQALSVHQQAHPEAATEEMRALVAQGNFADAQTVVSRLITDETEPSLANWVDVTLACILLSRTEPHAKSVAHHALLELRTRLKEFSSTAYGTDQMAALLEKVELTEIKLAVFEGRYADIADDLSRIFDDDSYSEPFRFSVGVWLSEVWAVMGRQEDGVQLTISLVNRLDDQTAMHVTEISGARLLGSLLLSGRWIECAQIMNRWRGWQRDNRQVETDEVFEGLLHAHCGRADEALALLLPAIDQLRARHRKGLLVLALAASAYAFCTKNDTDRVRALLAEIDLPAGKVSWSVHRAVDYFTALASAALIAPEDVIARLLSQADECRAHGATGYELFFLSAAVRLGHHESAERLISTSGRAQGPYAELCKVYGSGLAYDDSRQLLEAAQMARSIGHEQWCRDAAKSVLVCAEMASEAEHVQAARRLLNTFRDGPSDRDHLAGISNLTPREREIAILAAKGASSKAMAETLSVSVRTVEGHLYQIYGKLQLRGRAELEEMLT